MQEALGGNLLEECFILGVHFNYNPNYFGAWL